MKKEWWVYMAILAISAVFLFVSLMVFIYGTKSPKWTARKMRIGGILLTLNSLIATQACNREPEVMCYETVATDQMWLEPMNEGETTFSKFDTVNGAISYPQSDTFSYRIVSTEQKIIEKNDIFPQKDSASSFYSFNLKFPHNIQPGKYTIMLFSSSVEKQDSLQYLENKYQIIIKNE